MVKESNVYYVLAKLEHFVNYVPISKKAVKYKEWIKFRGEMKRALKDLEKTMSKTKALGYVEPIEVPKLIDPCPSRIPLKQITAKIIEPSSSEKRMMLLSIRDCRKIPER